MGRVRQKPRHKAGLAGQGTSQGLQVEKAQPSWGDGTEGLDRGRSKVLWGPSKGRLRSFSRATPGHDYRQALGVKLWSLKGVWGGLAGLGSFWGGWSYHPEFILHNRGGLAPPAGRGSLFRFGCYSWGGVSALWLGHLRLRTGLGFRPAVPVHLEVPVFT